MKTSFLSILVLAFTVSACGDNNTIAKEGRKAGDTVAVIAPPSNTAKQEPASIDEAVTAYLRLKNALTKDNGNEAAAAGKDLQAAFLKLDNATFAVDQKAVFDDVKEEIKEHAEHISTNGDKIAHQREHFDMVSNDMYDLVKSVKPGQTLYKDYCPMFNDNKGAVWLSEVREIRNPYYGKKMLSCGKQQEQIKQ